MSSLLPFLVLDQTCDQVLAWVNEKLTSPGFRVVQTFNLQVARLAHPECPCPHHGTDECNCQMVVLLIYGKQDDPATLVIHGQEHRSWVSVAGPVGKRSSQHFEITIRHTLISQLPDVSFPIEVIHEARSTI